MTRKEVVKSREYQISNAACKYADSIANDDRKTYCIEDFEAGANWADRHNNEALIEKAVKYIANHFLAPGMDNEINDFVNYMKGT